MESYIAFAGEKFTIEWYFDQSKESQAKEYYESLDDKMRTKTLALFERMVEFGVIRDKTKFREEGDKIYAFKPQPERFLCFFQKGKKIIVTNGFRKKGNKLPRAEKNRAKKHMTDYLKRTKEGAYYGD